MFSELYEFSKTSDVLGRPPCWGNAFIPTLRVVINLHPTFRSLAKEDHLSQAIQIALWCTLNVTEYLSLLPLFQLVNKTSFEWLFHQCLCTLQQVSQSWFYWHFGLAHFLSSDLREQQPSPPPTRCQQSSLKKDSKKHLQILSSISWRDNCSLLRTTEVETHTQVLVVEMIL